MIKTKFLARVSLVGIALMSTGHFGIAVAQAKRR